MFNYFDNLNEGRYMVLMKPNKTITPERIAAFFHAHTATLDDSSCIIWTGPLNKFGYGDMSLRVGSDRHAFRELAHRVSYRLHTRKDIPEQMCICHSCDNPRCVNPDHLFMVTQSENQLDALRKGRHTSQVTDHGALMRELTKTWKRSPNGTFLKQRK